MFIFIGLAQAQSLEFTNEEKEFIQNNTITVGVLEDFYPFSFYENETTKGFSYNLLKLISKKSNLKFEFVTDTWSNNYTNFTNNKIDLIDSISFTEKRAKFISFTKPYFEIPLVMYSKNDFSKYNGELESLKGITVGVTKDVFYSSKLEQLDLFKIVYFTSGKSKIKALTNGEIDVSIGSLFSTKKIVSQNNFKNLKILDELKIQDIKKEDLRLGIHKNNPILYSIINKTYNSLSQKESFKIKEKWLGIFPKRERGNFKNQIKLTKNEKAYLKRKKIIKMCNLHSFAPIEFLNKNGFPAGISIDTIKLIEKKLHSSIIIENVKTNSDKQSLEFFENKKCDVLPISMPQLHTKKHQYTVPYINYEAVVITRSEEPFINSLDDIKYKGVALKNSPRMLEHIQRTYIGISIVKTKTDKESFEKVSSGEVYSTMSILPIASYNITKYGFSNLKIAGHAQRNVKFHMAVNSPDNLLVSILNKSINVITQREKATIFNKWANIKYDKQINYSKIINVVLIALFIIGLLVYRQFMLSKNNEKLQKAKNKLEESNNHFRAILEATVEAIFITDENYNIVECNEMTCSMFDYKKEELLGMNMFNLVEDQDKQKVKNQVKINAPLPYEIYAVNKQNKKIPVLVRGSNITRNNKPHRVSIALNLTKLKKTQKALETLNKDLAIKIIDEVEKSKKKDLKLLHQARHAQMGELINMIAHQWRQPLNAIAATIMNIQLQLSLEKFDLSKENERERFSDFVNQKLVNIEDFIQTLSITIDDFRNFYKQDNQIKMGSVHTPIKKALGIIKALILSNKIEIILKLDSKKEIEIYESELLQVFLNVIKNAQDNFEDRKIPSPTITISTTDGIRGVIIEVLDNGGGIKSDVIDNIFDPYFSTKDLKNGTGLGLYMSKSIIEKHHKGKFYAQNQDEGVCFTIELHDNLK